MYKSNMSTYYFMSLLLLNIFFFFLSLLPKVPHQRIAFYFVKGYEFKA
jgi:hypothetical protein